MTRTNTHSKHEIQKGVPDPIFGGEYLRSRLDDPRFLYAHPMRPDLENRLADFEAN
jgi:hypothetical protein